MTPLRVTARLAGVICLPTYPLALDALLAYAVCVRDGIQPATLPSELVDVEVPLQRSACGAFHLASCGAYKLERAELRHIHKRAPIEQYQAIGGDKIKRVMITAGPNKSYRIPLETKHLVNDTIEWWCVGDAEQIESLLSLIHYLGKRRGVGLGRVSKWTIEAMGPRQLWEGFPVVRSGKPLRNLPPDWPGLVDPECAYANLTYPYWVGATEQLCAVP